MEIYEDNEGEFTTIVTFTNAPRRPHVVRTTTVRPRKQWGPYCASNTDSEEDKQPPGQKPRSDNDEHDNAVETAQAPVAFMCHHLDTLPKNERKKRGSSR